MDSASLRSLGRNLTLYSYVRLFSMRVFLPLTPIYLVEVGHLSLVQIGSLATIGAIASMAAEIPTSYFADRVKRRTSLLIGSLILMFATGLFVVFPQYPGAVVATLLTALGGAFLSGAGEALIHDSLEALGRVKDYVKVAGRAQAQGLVGHMVLIGLVPLTYSIDKRLPFALGALAFAILVVFVLFLREPARDIKPATKNQAPFTALARNLHTFVNRRTILFLMALGLLSALYTGKNDFNNLVFQDLGLNPALLGLVYGAASIAGAVGGYAIHYADRLSFPRYTMLDTLICGGFCLAVGLSQNLYVAIFAFLINMSFWRLRSIVCQKHLLDRFGATHNKATLISTISFFGQVHRIWVPLLLVAVINHIGYYAGYAWIGGVGIVVLWAAFLIAFRLIGVKDLKQELPKSVPH